MTIPTEIHARLSASERIRAAVSAIARGDNEELGTLWETCQRKVYRMADAAFSDGMERLLKLALIVEIDLARLMLDYLLAARRKDFEAEQQAFVGAASLEFAWGELLSEMGIPRSEMAEAGPPRHYAVKTLLQISEGEEDAADVQTILELLREYLA